MNLRVVVTVALAVLLGPPAGTLAQEAPAAPPAPGAQAAPADDPVRTLVGRLDLEKYKATIKGLTRFGDRRQGTDRNRAANDWIEAQLRSYGCSNTQRITYDYQPVQRPSGTPSVMDSSGWCASSQGMKP